SAEIGELLLGIALMVFAFDLFLRHGYTKHPGRWPAVGATFGLLVLVAAMSVALAHFFPVPHKWMLNTLATRDYASFGMYGQAHRIYEYMYENPQYLTSKTRIHHGQLLLKMGQREEAFRILSQAARNLESVNHQKTPRSKDLRRLATIHALMGRADEAGTGFDRAIEIDRKKLDLISDVDKKSEVMFSMAKTYEARGETATAIEWARYARANTSSPRFRSRIDKWLKALASRKEGRRYK
ncbi:MAG: tetratricopeptide repeat protein, partial [Deltaproteobacteria bacterium]|nr:tetratricopeptide repeat protein [Deltaproteobacteria bacterium]